MIAKMVGFDGSLPDLGNVRLNRGPALDMIFLEFVKDIFAGSTFSGLRTVSLQRRCLHCQHLSCTMW